MKVKKIEMNLKKNIKYKKKIKLLITTSTFGKNNPSLLKLFDKSLNKGKAKTNRFFIS